MFGNICGEEYGTHAQYKCSISSIALPNSKNIYPAPKINSNFINGFRMRHLTGVHFSTLRRMTHRPDDLLVRE